MRGLRKLEDEKFNTFFGFVQKEAENRGCVFFVLTTEGHDIVTEEFEGEYMTGWLVPIDRADEFEKEWQKTTADCSALKDLKKWAEFFCWEIWEYENSKLKIVFDFYEDIVE